jgi:hypothetical protein
MEDWLPLYAVALANGTIAEDLGPVSWETTFVRVLNDLDGAHLQMLDLRPFAKRHPRWQVPAGACRAAPWGVTS